MDQIWAPPTNGSLLNIKAIQFNQFKKKGRYIKWEKKAWKHPYIRSWPIARTKDNFHNSKLNNKAKVVLLAMKCPLACFAIYISKRERKRSASNKFTKMHYIFGTHKTLGGSMQIGYRHSPNSKLTRTYNSSCEKSPWSK